MVLTLVLLEGAARLAERAYPKPIRNATAAIGPGAAELAPVTNPTLLHAYTQPHPGRGYSLVPGYEGGAIRINRWGMRGGEFAVPKPPDVFRVLCVGDSVTFGLSTCASYPERVHDILAPRALPGRRVEIVNAGVEGYSVTRALAALEADWFALEPDALFVMIGWNDLLALGTSRQPLDPTATVRYFEMRPVGFAASAAELPWPLRATALGRYATRAWYGAVVPRRARAELRREARTWRRGELIRSWDGTSAETLAADGIRTTLATAGGAAHDELRLVSDRIAVNGPVWLRASHATTRGARTAALVRPDTGEPVRPFLRRSGRDGKRVVEEQLYLVAPGETVAVYVQSAPGNAQQPAALGLRVSLYPAVPPTMSPAMAAPYRARLTALVEAARERGIRVVLSTLPSRIGPHLSEAGRDALVFPAAYADDFAGFAEFYALFNDTIREVGRAEGIPVLETAAAMHTPDVETIIFDHCHFTCDGTQRLAAYVADALADFPWLPAE